MKRVAHILIAMIASLGLSAQALPLSTQFMFNKLSYNPAFAGHYELAHFTGLVRNQWVGFEGAPRTQLVSANVPIWRQRIGLGLTISNYSIGVTNRIGIDGAYAYRIPVSESGMLSIGLQTGVGRYVADFTSPDLIAIDGRSIDPAIPNVQLNQTLLNLGVGIYYSTDDFYVGASVPRFTEQNLSDGSAASTGTDHRQIHAMIGGALPMGFDWSFMPELLFTYSENLPWDLDANVSVMYRNRLRLGLGYRYGGDDEGFGESLDFIFGLYINEQLMIGAAYDYSLSRLRDVSSGSIELILSYGLSSPSKREINPRFF